ncbi:hypothetical protein ACWGIR_23265, partial [Streptomyces albidoflavus]
DAEDAEEVADAEDAEEVADAEDAEEVADAEDAEEVADAEDVAAPLRGVPYAIVLAQLSDTDSAVREAAKAEWDRRLAIYREASNDKDPAKRIVGPAMAAALEAEGSQDGRTRAALVRRGLAERGEGTALVVNEAGRKALAAAQAAVA